MLRGLTPDDLDRVVDRRWDPPVTLGVRLVSIGDDCLQHVGQAAYVRGLLDAGNLTASNFTVAQNITPSAGTLTALVGGNETGQLNLQKGSAGGGRHRHGQ